MRRLILAVISLLCLATLVGAHDTEIIRCDRNLKVDSVTKLVEQIDSSNGTLSEGYDRNGDGKVDIEVVSALRMGEKVTDKPIPHNPHPILWIVDLDFDGRPDMVYHDIHGEGNCEDIKPYKDLTTPHGENPDERPSGRI